jgi:hypothetical protein
MHRLILSFTVAVFLGALRGQILAQSVSTAKPVVHPVSLAFTFDAAEANITTANRFWFTGGSAELSAEAYRGIGITASVTGVRTSDSGSGVPVNLIVATLGPSYTFHTHIRRHSGAIFAQGLIGEANGFHGIYPSVPAPVSSANSLAAQVGGGVDLNLSRHLALRCFEASWLRTALPNSTSGVQNDIRMGAGVAVHLGYGRGK